MDDFIVEVSLGSAERAMPMVGSMCSGRVEVINFAELKARLADGSNPLPAEPDAAELPVKFRFSSKKDAVLFKLTFGGSQEPGEQS